MHLLHKAFLIRARVGADGSDGVKNQHPNRFCGNVVSKTLPRFLSGTQTVSGTVIVVTGIKAAFGVNLHTIPERPAAPLVVLKILSRGNIRLGLPGGHNFSLSLLCPKSTPCE